LGLQTVANIFKNLVLSLLNIGVGLERVGESGGLTEFAKKSPKFQF